MTNKHDLDIVLCIEQGYLEQQAKFLIQSFRLNAGSYANCNIYAYQPRKRYPVSKEMKLFLKENEVHFSDENLNKELPYFNFANKSAVLSHHERNAKAKNILWLDCDIFFLNEPTSLANTNNNSILLRPEDGKGLASNPRLDDYNGEMWKSLYQLFGVNYDGTSYFTIKDYQEVNPYFNAGMFETCTKTGFLQQYNENLLRASRLNLYPKSQETLLEQVIFSLTTTQMNLKIQQKPSNYNFPINLWLFDKILHPQYQDLDFDKLCCGHYHKIFLRGENQLENYFSKTKKGNIMNQLIGQFDLTKKVETNLKYRLKKKSDELIMRIWKI